MAPSTPRFDRTKHHQDSPTFWLLVMAGSLALHLIVLLAGRWYITRTTQAKAAGSPTPIEFVEIDPNATIPKTPTAISPAPDAVASAPQAAPPLGDPSVTQSDDRTPSIVQPPASIPPEPVRPDVKPPVPPKKPNPAPRSDVQPKPERPTPPSEPPTPPSEPPTPPSEPPTPPSEPPTPPSEQNNSEPSNNSPGQDSPNNPNPSNQPGDSTQGNPNSEPSNGNPSEPAGSNQQLPTSSGIATEIVGPLVPTNGGLQTGEKSARLKGTIPTLELSGVAIPDNSAEERFTVVISNADGKVDNVMLADPEARKDPKRSLLEGIALQVLQQPEVVFEVEKNSAGVNRGEQSAWEITLRISLK